jgi:hypothetical protein
MNHIKKGYNRDKQILEEVANLGVLNTQQVYRLFFKKIRYGEKKAQQRLKKLHEKKKLNRCRIDVHEPYCYYMERRPAQLEHIVFVNWVYIYLLETLPQWEKITDFQREYVIGNVRSDAFAEIYNVTTKKYRYLFVECDRAESKNPFNKVQVYNQLFESNDYMKTHWYHKLKVQDKKFFPDIYVFTDSPNKLRNINKTIERENKNNLVFKTFLIGEIIQCGS